MGTPWTYPVKVEGQLDSHLNRWVWLVKWLLAIPHYIVLWFLWVAFFVLSLVALVAIVFTGRYPRGIFDFNVGVLRWTWRVLFYSYAALGTDRYPPFSLGPEPGYPATLEVAYPGELSRGLALVKWWLLAIPHYLVLAVFLGGGAWAVSAYDARWASGGLLGVLVLIAAVALLFTRRYPLGIFDLVLGLNRWALRVAAYAALMTDEYPPFRLDMGGSEPRAVTLSEPAPPAPAAAAMPAATGLTGGRVAAIVVASLLGLVGFGLFAAGGVMLIVSGTQRDDDGFVTSPSERFTTGTYAIVSESVDVDVTGPDEVAADFLGDVRVTTESDTPLFVGIARDRDAAQYLDAMERAIVTDLDDGSERYRPAGSAPPSGPPAEQEFWAASATGSGTQRLDWKPEDGDWTAVVMNADGSRGVVADVKVGAELDDLGWAGVAIGAAGLVLMGATVAILWAALRRRT